jgi:hypothetical protein
MTFLALSPCPFVYVLTQMPHLGEKTGADYGVRGVKETSIIAEIELERKILKLNTNHTLRDEGRGKDDV